MNSQKTSNESNGKKAVSEKKKTPAALLLAVFVILVVLDQITKYLAVSGLKGQNAIVLIPGVLELQYLENIGAAFSIMEGRQWFFYILTTVFLVFVCVILRRLPADAKYNALRWCAIVLSAGAVGNFIDRLINKYVVDFIYFSLINFPIFNVADIYVTLSVAVLVILLFFYYKEEDLEMIWGGKKTEE
ncbi:MAG: signal peptidase II [Eubacteriales bacterium]|nr:signal peptidase II [Eubacteriales bacterium]